jgi:deferrochelatase/peroxidase EfeB
MSTPQQVLEANALFIANHGSKLQGNILKAHGREHVSMMFLWFSDTTQIQNFREFLSNMAVQPAASSENVCITSAARQMADTFYHKVRQRSRLFFGVYLGAEALKKLLGNQQIKDNQHWQSILAELDNNKDLLKPEGFDFHSPPHLTILLAHSSKDFLRGRVQFYTELFKEHYQFEKVETENGMVQRNSLGQSVEHFGYADSLSQPWFVETDLPVPVNVTLSKWNPIRNATDFLVEEKTTGDDCWGSFFVWRKLEQNVALFHGMREKMSTSLKVDEEQAGAMLIGRQTDGTPFVPPNQALPANDPMRFHDFDFNDPGTPQCPIHAHIRKMNPRTNMEAPVIIRRGITYGERAINYQGNFDKSKLPSKDVGMHFMSFQKSVGHFQELLFRANENKQSLDPITAKIDRFFEEDDRKDTFKHTFDLPNQIGNASGNTSTTITGLGGFVKVRGGANFYAPSIPFFLNLKTVNSQQKKAPSANISPKTAGVKPSGKSVKQRKPNLPGK